MGKTKELLTTQKTNTMEDDVKKVIDLLNKLDDNKNYSNVYLSSKYIWSIIDNLEESINLINLDEQK